MNFEKKKKAKIVWSRHPVLKLKGFLLVQRLLAKSLKEKRICDVFPYSNNLKQFKYEFMEKK